MRVLEIFSFVFVLVFFFSSLLCWFALPFVFMLSLPFPLIVWCIMRAIVLHMEINNPSARWIQMFVYVYMRH